MCIDRSRQLVTDWAEVLADRVGRSSELITTDGLRATDFPCTEPDIVIEFDDGSMVRFRCAFAVSSPDQQTIAVFTEHCGHHLLPGGTTVKRATT